MILTTYQLYDVDKLKEINNLKKKTWNIVKDLNYM